MEYKCECCLFSTKKKYNYDKHLLSTKHQLLESKSIVSQKLAEVSPKLAEVSPKGIFCKYCDKEYKHKSSLSKHIKYSCTKNKDEDLKELVRLLNLRVETEKKEKNELQKKLDQQQKVFDKRLDTQSKQIEKLMGKLEIHGSFNNNTINNITLLAYRNTDVSHLTTEDYIGFYKKVNHCVKQMIEKIHFIVGLQVGGWTIEGVVERGVGRAVGCATLGW